MSERTRAYVYRVLASLLPLLVLLGVLTQDVAAEVAAILGAVFLVGEGGLVLAARNTSTAKAVPQ